MIIRRAKSSDLESIAKIYKKAYSEKPYFESWKEKLVVKNLRRDIKDSTIYVAEENKKIAGFIVFSIYEWYNGKWAYIEDFAILKEYRGMGVGKSLMDRAESNCKKANVRRIVLDVHTKADALKMYEKRGYKKNGYITMEKKLK